ncbi:MAG: hypothetical protein ACJAT7_002652 [Psychromonas sp.]|jgi:hypothetical protein|uniref:hypothetical protein n=1 Tax=Psychromonas sp. TaxID=1884585 RepID=UPI0039E67473
MNKKFLLASLFGSSIILFACGGSSEDDPVVDTAKSVFVESLSGTSWERECYPVYDGATLRAYNNSTLSINSTLQVTYNVELFAVADTTCNSLMQNVSFTSQFAITDKIISDESIETYGINSVFVDSPDITEMASTYSLIYIDGENLHLGVNSGTNLGDSPETRHSSISLDDYFSKVLN